MADNPFSVEPVNPLQALLIGQKSYDAANEAQQQRQLIQTRAQAAQDFSGGDYKSGLARLLGAGDMQGAHLAATQLQNQWTQQHTTSQDALNAQHWNADYGLRKAASVRADDPTPAGFEKQTDGSYAPLRGGPQDPAYQASVAAETAKAKGDVPTIIGAGSSVIVPNQAEKGAIFTNKPSSSLTDYSTEMKARQLINGDYSGLKNMGKGAQGAEELKAISNRAGEVLATEYGLNPKEAADHLGKKLQEFNASGIYQNQEARTSAGREANLNLILRATEAAIPAALEQSEKVSRTGWVPLNKVIQRGQVMTSDPELRKFGMANLQLAEHWARAMNPLGVMRESDRDLALHFLSTADSKDTYKQAVMQLKTQITRERDAVKGGKETTRPGGAAPVPGAEAASNKTGTGVSWSIE